MLNSKKLTSLSCESWVFYINLVQRDMFFGKFLCFSIRILGIICIFVPRLQGILVLRFLRNIVLRYAWVFWKLTKEVIEIIQNAFEEVFFVNSDNLCSLGNKVYLCARYDRKHIES